MLKFKKAQTSTDTPILISIIAFQAFIILALGFLNVNYASQKSINSTSINATYQIQTYNVPLTNLSITNIITNISYLGFANVLIFSPIIGAIIYIIAKLIRGGG